MQFLAVRSKNELIILIYVNFYLNQVVYLIDIYRIIIKRFLVFFCIKVTKVPSIHVNLLK